MASLAVRWGWLASPTGREASYYARTGASVRSASDLVNERDARQVGSGSAVEKLDDGCPVMEGLREGAAAMPPFVC